MPGNLGLDRLQELFGVRIEETGEATTVSGLVTSTLGRVPAPGEILQRDGLTFQVTEANGRRVVRLLVPGPVEKASAEKPVAEKPAAEKPTAGKPPNVLPSSDQPPGARNHSRQG